VTNAVVQVLLIVALGHLLYDVSWPKDWMALAWSSRCWASLAHGVAGHRVSPNVIPNFDAAPAYINAVFPAGDLHLGRLLRRLEPAVGAEGDRRGAAAEST